MDGNYLYGTVGLVLSTRRRKVTTLLVNMCLFYRVVHYFTVTWLICDCSIRVVDYFMVTWLMCDCSIRVVKCFTVTWLMDDCSIRVVHYFTVYVTALLE